MAAGLAEQDVDADPIVQFQRWLAEAADAGLIEPTAMVLATAGAGGQPAARLVLFKGLRGGGFSFFTNFDSDKGTDLAANPRAALVFPWHDLQRQVRVTGPVELLSERDADEYFAGRPHGAQVGAWASPQSEVIPDRAFLEARAAQFEERFGHDAVPRPPRWGGYRVVPGSLEFWQGRADRLHDRIRYLRTGGGWTIERLAP